MNEQSIPVEAELTLFRPRLSNLKRRGARRFRCGLATIGKLHFPNESTTLEACVYNLSQTGVGLNLAAPLEVGRDLVIQVRVPGSRDSMRVSARVVHCTQEVDRSWRIGCAFAEPISPEVLEALLE